ncbi:MAG: ATP-binding protein [Desulfobacteraceae bacterium]|jgi:signal transduction histidine kinase/AmiR/NasT family two-component response regulator
MTLRQKAVVVFFISSLVAALYGVNHWGVVIRHQAVEKWLEKANDDTQRITATSLNWLSLFQTQLRGIAALFYGSQEVTQDEFLNAIYLVEGVEVEAMVPLTMIAYAEQQASAGHPQNDRASANRFPVTLSSDVSGPLSIGTDLADHRQICSVIQSALMHPEKVIQGPVFRGENDQIFTAFSLTAPNAGKPGALISIVNISNFIVDLGILYIPEGLNLRIVERSVEGKKDSDRIIHGGQAAPVQAVATAYFPTQSGQAHWDYFWDILPDYAGGPATALGTVIQLGGSALVLAFFAIIAFLQLRNFQVNRIVAKRTEELIEMTQAAEAANAAKSDFLARMSHEIRTPLNAVTGLTTIVLKSELSTEQRGYLNKAQIASNNLLHVINDILDFSKVEAGKLDLERHPFELDQLLEQLTDLVGNQVGQKDVELSFAVAQRVPRQVTGDAGRLIQVLTNLVGNAIKFTDRGEIVVGVDLDDEAPKEQDQTALKFRVSDTGAGINSDLLPKLFDPFTQVDDSLTRRHEGTGLGLAICRHLVKLMGGRIWAESTPGKGSTFYFTVMLEARRELSEAVRPRRAQEPDEPSFQRLAGHRVLVVEDSELNIDVAVALLEETGLTVETAENGRVAVDKVIKSPRGYYDAVLMDIQMPIMDGYEATRHIRVWESKFQYESPDFSACRSPITDHRIPIIALTAHAIKGEKEKCLAADMDDYLSKPLDEREMRRMLLKWITSRQEERGASN